MNQADALFDGYLIEHRISAHIFWKYLFITTSYVKESYLTAVKKMAFCPLPYAIHRVLGN